MIVQLASRADIGRKRFGTALCATTALAAVLAATPALARKPADAPAAAVQSATIDFSIPPGPLGDVLAAFGARSGMRIAVDPATVRGIASSGASGTMTPQDALSQIVAGTGFTYRIAGNTVTLQSSVAAVGPAGAIQLAPVRVDGQSGTAPGANPYADPAAPYKADRLASSKFTQPIVNTPRSVTVLTKEALDDKDATTIREIARSTAGVTLGSGEGGNAFGDRFFIRGFDARNDVFVDGVRDPGVSVRETFNVEQVEILRGPASSFAGRGTTGGAVNIVTKSAQPTRFDTIEATAGLGFRDQRVEFDLNQPLTSELAVRVGGVWQNARIPGRDFATDKRSGIAAAVTFQPTPDFSIKANYSYTEVYGLPDYGVPYNQLSRGPVTEFGIPRNTYYGVVNRDFTRSIQAMGTVDMAWKLADWLSIENKLRQSYSILNYVGTIPENPSANTPATAPFSSTPTFYSGYTQLNAQSRYEPVNVIAYQPQATFTTGPGALQNTLVVGGEFSRERISIDSYTGFTSELTTGPVAFTSSGAPIVSIANPTHYVYGAGVPQLTGNPLRYRVSTAAAYAMDTLNYRDVVIVNVGIRHDDYGITSTNNTSSRSADSGITSYNAGLVVKPARDVSLYAAYATAADPVGDELDATSSAYGGLSATQNAAQIFGPIRSKAFEVGAKAELFQEHLLATAAAFQTDVSNARESAPANLPGYTQGQIVAGAAYRVKGLDFELAGNITDKWSILSGLVLMQTRVKQSIVPTNIGLQLANIAHQSFNLLSKYQLTPWLELGGQAIYASQIKGGSLFIANGGVAYPKPPYPTLLPSHWRFDAFVEAKVNERVELKLNGQNLFDKTYYDSLYQSAQPFIMVAPGRNVSLVLTVKL